MPPEASLRRADGPEARPYLFTRAHGRWLTRAGWAVAACAHQPESDSGQRTRCSWAGKSSFQGARAKAPRYAEWAAISPGVGVTGARRRLPARPAQAGAPAGMAERTRCGGPFRNPAEDGWAAARDGLLWTFCRRRGLVRRTGLLHPGRRQDVMSKKAFSGCVRRESRMREKAARRREAVVPGWRGTGFEAAGRRRVSPSFSGAPRNGHVTLGAIIAEGGAGVVSLRWLRWLRLMGLMRWVRCRSSWFLVLWASLRKEKRRKEDLTTKKHEKTRKGGKKREVTNGHEGKTRMDTNMIRQVCSWIRVLPSWSYPHGSIGR